MLNVKVDLFLYLIFHTQLIKYEYVQAYWPIAIKNITINIKYINIILIWVVDTSG